MGLKTWKQAPDGKILKSDVTIDGTALNERDGLGIWETDKISFKANSQDAEILFMEVPMNVN